MGILQTAMMTGAGLYGINKLAQAQQMRYNDPPRAPRQQQQQQQQQSYYDQRDPRSAPEYRQQPRIPPSHQSRNMRDDRNADNVQYSSWQEVKRDSPPPMPREYARDGRQEYYQYQAVPPPYPNRQVPGFIMPDYQDYQDHQDRQDAPQSSSGSALPGPPTQGKSAMAGQKSAKKGRKGGRALSK